MNGVPWKELALGVTALGVCYAIGWYTGAANLEQKRVNRNPNEEANEEDIEIRALLHHADQAFKKGAFSEVERAYLRLCEITKESRDPSLRELTPHMYRRLAELYEKTQQADKALKYLELCVDAMISRGDLSQDDLQHLSVLVERCVDISAVSSPQDKYEKFLNIWLETATKTQQVEAVVMASTLLGRLKSMQEKWVEAEALLRRSLQHYTSPFQREELWLSSKALHVQSLTVLEKHEEAKKGFKEIAEFLMNNENPNIKRQLLHFDELAREMLINIGDRCLFLGYYEEAEYIMKSNLVIMKRRKATTNETAVIDNGLAVVYSETGRLPQAREKVKEIKDYLRGSGLFPSYSKYLHTAGVKHEDGKTILSLYLARESSRLLKSGSVLVIEFENPEVPPLPPHARFALDTHITGRCC